MALTAALGLKCFFNFSREVPAKTEKSTLALPFNWPTPRF